DTTLFRCAAEGAGSGWPVLGESLMRSGRATRRLPGSGGGTGLWLAAERLPQAEAPPPEASFRPLLTLPDPPRHVAWPSETALGELVRSRLEVDGPTTADALIRHLGVRPSQVEI